jgi:hypothetical protein
MPWRRLELPYENTRSPAVVPLVSRPTGPPQCGMVGLTLATSAGSIRMRAKSLNAQVSASVSPRACIVIHEL